MSEPLRTDFEGVGSMEAFVVEVVKALRAFNGAQVLIPADAGIGTLAIEGGKLVLDMTASGFITAEDLEDLDGTPDTTGAQENMVLTLDADLVPEWDWVRLVTVT